MLGFVFVARLFVLQTKSQQSVLQCAGHVSGHRMLDGLLRVTAMCQLKLNWQKQINSDELLCDMQHWEVLRIFEMI